jgi:hypothetical protein
VLLLLAFPLSWALRPPSPVNERHGNSLWLCPVSLSPLPRRPNDTHTHNADRKNSIAKFPESSDADKPEVEHFLASFFSSTEARAKQHSAHSAHSVAMAIGSEVKGRVIHVTPALGGAFDLPVESSDTVSTLRTKICSHLGLTSPDAFDLLTPNGSYLSGFDLSDDLSKVGPFGVRGARSVCVVCLVGPSGRVLFSCVAQRLAPSTFLCP